MINNNKILLVEPEFPYPNKSKNKANEIHKNFIPIGLLKLGAYYKSFGCNVQLVRGNVFNENINFRPDIILITSLFTYWSKYVWNSVEHYRGLFPKAQIIIGGIYSTLHHDLKYFKDKLNQYSAECYAGLHLVAESHYPKVNLCQG